MKSQVWWTSFRLGYLTIVLRRPLEAMHPTSMPLHQQVQPLLFNSLSLKLRTANCCRRLHLNPQVSQRSTSLRNQQALGISKTDSYHSRLAFSNSNNNQVSSRMSKVQVIRVPGLLCRQCRRVMDQISLQRRLAINHQCLLMLNLRDGLDSGDS